MNGRALAIGSGLLVAATGTALIGSASAAADSAPDRVRHAVSRRSNLARPRSVASNVASPVGLPSVDPAVKAHNDTVVIARFVEAVNTARWLEALGALERAQQAAARSNLSRPSARSSSGGGNVLECIKHRESRGQYDVVNGSSGAAGAYQFMPGTWDNNARSAGRTDLVGVNPANASPADQDAMAQHLLATQGLGPWGGGCG